MSLEVFRAGLTLAVKRDPYTDITIGGGEPTLHPLLFQFLDEAIAATTRRSVFIVVNGSNKELALKVAEMGQKGLIDAHMSYDQYHDLSMVDPAVIEAFRNQGWRGLWGGNERPWRNPESVIKQGRAIKQIPESKRVDDCCCPVWMIKPSGIIKQCGCNKAPSVGNVYAGIVVEKYKNRPERCYRSFY